MASWLVRSSLDRAVRVRALAGDIVLCSWARHFTLTVPLSTQVYKWVPANSWGNLRYQCTPNLIIFEKKLFSLFQIDLIAIFHLKKNSKKKD